MSVHLLHAMYPNTRQYFVIFHFADISFLVQKLKVTAKYKFF